MQSESSWVVISDDSRSMCVLSLGLCQIYVFKYIYLGVLIKRNTTDEGLRKTTLFKKDYDTQVSRSSYYLRTNINLN